MKIRTYENSVQHGVIDTLKREDLVRDLSSRAQDAQRIITAPALSGRQDAEANESAEAAAAANAEKRAKSLAGAFREFAGNEVKRALKRAPGRAQGISGGSGAAGSAGKATAGVKRTGGAAPAKLGAARGFHSGAAAQKAAVMSARSAEKIAAQGVRVVTRKTAEAAGTTAKAAVSAGAGAATARLLLGRRRCFRKARRMPRAALRSRQLP